MAENSEIFERTTCLRRSIRMKAATELLDCDSKTLRRLLTRGELEGHRLGARDLRIYIDSIENYRNRNSVGECVNARPAQTFGETVSHRRAMDRLKKRGIY